MQYSTNAAPIVAYNAVPIVQELANIVQVHKICRHLFQRFRIFPAQTGYLIMLLRAKNHNRAADHATGKQQYGITACEKIRKL